jgi:NADH-quinone oxidoreductase subunit N
MDAAEATQIDWFALAPELAVLATALLVLLVELFLCGQRKRFVNPLAVVGVLVALGLVVALAVDGSDRAAFGEMFVADSYALAFKGLFLSVALFVLLISYRYFAEIRTFQGEYYFLILSAFIGMMLMPSARDFVMLFVALELVSIPGFIMAGLRKFDPRSNEGAMKFLIIGILSASTLLFGLSIVYAFTGTTSLAGTAAALTDVTREPLLLVGTLFVLVGFGFKVSAVPFHFWAPDTYEGAPIPVAAFLSVASKAAGFAGLLQVSFVAFEPLSHAWAPVVAVIAVLTMTLGNVTALAQRNVVRLLAYSSVAHAGYMLVPFALVRPGEAALNSSALSAVLVYLFAYAVMNIGAFAVVTAVARRHPGRHLDDYAGLGQRSPGMAGSLTLFLLSLGGTPPLVGFFAKVAIFAAAVEAGQADQAGGYVLAVAVVVNTVISVSYYLRVAGRMWMSEPTDTAPVQPGYALGFAVGGLAVLTVGLGVLAPLVTHVADQAVIAAGG